MPDTSPQTRHPLFAAREVELRQESEAREKRRRRVALLGTRAFGPFQEFEVSRHDDGTIYGVSDR